MESQILPYFRARRPVLWIATQEESRAEYIIGQILRKLSRSTDENKAPVYGSWSLIADNGAPGWTNPRGENGIETVITPLDQTDSAHMAVLNFANLQYENLCVGLFRSAHNYLDDMQFIQALKEASVILQNTLGTVVCVSPSASIPDELRSCVTIVEPGPPAEDTLRSYIVERLENYKKVKANLFQKGKVESKEQEIINGISNTIEDIVDASKGLTLSETGELLHYSFTTKQGKIDVGLIADKKAERLSTVPGLKLEKKQFTMDDVGGLDNLKKWIYKRKAIFSDKAKEFGVNPPKGMLVLGPPGNGKSLVAKSISSLLNLPLLSLNLNELKGGIVGETESRTRNAFRYIDAIGSCVLWADEIEKGVPANSAKNLDSGASAGMLQILLKWLQEREGNVFVVMTANDVSGIPPELLRKGRLDEVFFVDLPGSPEEIKEILKIHIEKKKRKFKGKELDSLSEKLINKEGAYTGAEIEAAVNEALITAYSESRELTIKDIENAALNSVPIYKTMKEPIEDLREWCKNRAVPASSVSVRQSAKKKNRKKIVNDLIEDLGFEEEAN